MNKLFIKAFTLIELLVVIAVIGILSGLIVVSMNGVTQKATTAKAQVFSNSLRNSLMLNLVSEWRLDGDAKDSWSGGNNGAINGPTLTTTGCVQGYCYSFDGNDFIEVFYNANIRPVSKISFSGWGYRNDWSNAGNSRILSCTEAGGYNITIYAGTADAFVYANGYTTPTFYTSSPSSGWHYFVGTYDGRRAKVYFDGVLADNHDFGASYSLGYSYNNSLIIGAEASTGTGSGEGYFVGKIDEIRIYNDSVPASQIKEQYFLGLNSLLNNGSIDKEEYLSRINNISSR